MFWQSHDHLDFDWFCTEVQFEFLAEVILLCPFFGSSSYISNVQCPAELVLTKDPSLLDNYILNEPGLSSSHPMSGLL